MQFPENIDAGRFDLQASVLPSVLPGCVGKARARQFDIAAIAAISRRVAP